MRMRKGIALGLLLALVVSGVAFAEGWWESSMTNVRRGFASRAWNDTDNDNAWTIVRLDGCRDEVSGNDPNDWGTIRLWKHAGLFPPYSMGDKKLWCYTAAQGNWGEQQGSQWFHFTVHNYSGPTDSWNVFDASRVQVWY